MQMHILRHHPEINLAAAQKTTQQQQPTLPSLFQAKFPANSDRAQKITNAIAIFIALDMRSFSVVENEGFKYLLSVLPKLQEKTKAKVEEGLSTAESIAITTDGWTSRALDRYMTITAHYITGNWQIANHVLQTRPVYESHTSDHLSGIHKEAVIDWKISRETGDATAALAQAGPGCGY